MAMLNNQMVTHVLQRQLVHGRSNQLGDYAHMLLLTWGWWPPGSWWGYPTGAMWGTSRSNTIEGLFAQNQIWGLYVYLVWLWNMFFVYIKFPRKKYERAEGWQKTPIN
jgi:hypothetical protein